MVAEEFLNYIEKFKVTDYVGMADFADRFNYLFTSVVILMCIAIVSVKQYFSSSLSCYIPNSPSGHDFDDYVENYCWVHGTIPLYSWEKTPQDEEWDVLDKTRKLNYYQWVPFMLAVQCIMFYLPRVLWLIICYNRTGTDLEHVVDTAGKAAHESGESRTTAVEHIVSTLDDLLFQHRELREGRVTQRQKVGNMLKFCCFSKHLGTMLIGFYFVVKCLAFANAVGQLYLMKSFLGFNSTMTNFGWQLLRDIINGQDWEDNLVFPRVAHCVVRGIRITGFSQNSFTAQCALPVNMLNEKIYIFLWFWTVMICVVLGISLPLWVYRLGSAAKRHTFVKRCLRISQKYENDARTESRAISRFINGFLRPDGVFIIQMIQINAGDLITTEIVTQLWALYKKKYYELDFRKMVNGPNDSDHKTLDDVRSLDNSKPYAPSSNDLYEDKNFV